MSPGDRVITYASEHNATLEAIARTRSEPLSRPLPAISASGVLVVVENTTEDDVPLYGVLGLGDSVFGPGADTDAGEMADRIAFQGVDIEAPKHLGNFVVCQEPIPAGELGIGMISGITPALIDVIDERDRFVDVEVGEQIPRSRPSGGALIRFKESGTGTKWALIDLTGMHETAHRYLGEITAVGSPTDHVWPYTIREVYPYEPWPANAMGVVTDGRTGTAHAGFDAGNTATRAGAVATNGADYPGGFSAQPYDVGAIVWIREIPDDEDGVTRFFDGGNVSHDGTCP
jgi:hypothetical protein